MVGWTLAAVGLFVAAQLGAGAIVARGVRGAEDYLVGGRRLGFLLAGFSIFATWFAAESIVGASAAIRDEGLSGGRADPVGYALALLILGLLLAARLRATGAMTLPEVIEKRFGRVARRLLALVMIPQTALYAAAQIRGFGEVLSALSSMEISASILVATAVVVVYTAMGGILGDVYTDLVQGIIVLLGISALLAAVVGALGGPEKAIGHITREQLALVPEGESLWERLDTWLVPVVGAMIVQESVSRVLACRSVGAARASALFGGGLYLLFGAVPVLIGLFGAHLAVDAEGEAFVPALAAHLLPPWLHVVFLGALVAAILSTVDSSLLAIGAVVSNDLLPQRLRSRRLGAARVATVLAGLAAAALALSAEGIYDIVLMADGLGTAGIAVVGVAALRSKFGGPRAACAALIAAFATSIVLANLTDFAAPFIASLGAALIVFVVVGLAERAQSPVGSRRT